jgi:predicted O-linked N-acetylglucosamine transferase (SPINDLY family)
MLAARQAQKGLREWVASARGAHAARHAPHASHLDSLASKEVFMTEPDNTRRGRQAPANPRDRPATSEAQGWFDAALELDRQGKRQAALDAVTTAHQMAPTSVPVAILKASLELNSGQPETALRTIGQVKAGKKDPLGGVLHALRARAYDELGQPERAHQEFRLAHRELPGDAQLQADWIYLAARLCDWKTRDTLWPSVEAAGARGEGPINPFLYLFATSDRKDQRQAAERWSKQFDLGLPRPKRRNQGARIRVGYLSSDFHNHPVALLTAGLFEHHDRSRFEVFGYSVGPQDQSEIRKRLEVGFDRFFDAQGISPADLAERIRKDAIDILVDLNGHTQNAPTSVGAMRPAPIQVAYLGYPGTSGAPWIDFVIADQIVAPHEHEMDFSEAVVRLPHCFQINDLGRTLASRPERSAFGLPDEAVVFCCFHTGFKINAAVFADWIEIAQSVPGSVLWFLLRPKDAPMRENLQQAARDLGFDPQRLVFLTSDTKGRSYPEYLALFGLADLLLDSTPYGAHTTASEALWAGCPLVTWIGESYASRVGASLLRAVGLPELIASDAAGYRALAIALARDPERRLALRRYLEHEGRASSLFDTALTTRAIESAYETMIDQLGRSEPSSFDVPEHPGARPRSGWKGYLRSVSERLRGKNA